MKGVGKWEVLPKWYLNNNFKKMSLKCLGVGKSIGGRWVGRVGGGWSEWGWVVGLSGKFRELSGGYRKL